MFSTRAPTPIGNITAPNLPPASAALSSLLLLAALAHGCGPPGGDPAPGAAVDSACSASGGCVDGAACKDGFCRTLCGGDRDCNIATHRCDGSVCLPGSGDCGIGYQLDGSLCVDIDECLSGNHACDLNARCNNIAGAYQCSCHGGYSGDGFSCSDIDECSGSTSGCDALAGCTNEVGGYRCGSCPAGYFDWGGNGSDCVDINECFTATHNCSSSADCVNTRGGFSCASGSSGAPLPLVTFDVLPYATDSALARWLEPHVVYRDPNQTPRGRLYVHLAGSLGKPSNSRLILQTAATLGYHAIGLRYPNSWTIAGLCGSDSSCYRDARDEIINGTDSSAMVEISRSESIENRLIKLLQYLANNDPGAGWESYLQNNTAPQWSSIAIGGHSQGGGHAARIAMQHTVDRLVTFSSPTDGIDSAAIPWSQESSATPSTALFGLLHLRESSAAKITANWLALGYDSAVTLTSVDSGAPPYDNRRMLMTERLPQSGSYADAHGSTVVDNKTPLDAAGVPMLLAAWRYLLGG